MTGLDKAVLGQAIQAAIGEDEVQALMLTTHDLDPQFFEGEILPVFLGNNLQHTQRTRALQLEHEIRERDVAIDVYYEGRALAAHEGEPGSAGPGFECLGSVAACSTRRS